MATWIFSKQPKIRRLAGVINSQKLTFRYMLYSEYVAEWPQRLQSAYFEAKYPKSIQIYPNLLILSSHTTKKLIAPAMVLESCGKRITLWTQFATFKLATFCNILQRYGAVSGHFDTTILKVSCWKSEQLNGSPCRMDAPNRSTNRKPRKIQQAPNVGPFFSSMKVKKDWYKGSRKNCTSPPNKQPYLWHFGNSC